MPNCAECKPCRTFPTVKALVCHLNVAHQLTVLSRYSCGEEGCLRKFPSLKSYKQHLQSHELKINSESISSIRHENEDAVVIFNQTDGGAETDSSELGVSLADGIFQSLLKDQADAFICKYYSKSGLPRNVVQDIVDDTQSFLSDGAFMNILEDKVLGALKSVNCDPSVTEEISEMFVLLKNPFSHLKTEHLRLQHFMKSGNYIESKTFHLGRRLERVRTKSGVKSVWVEVTAEYIPLAPVLKKFLEQPDALDSILAYMERLMNETDSLSNFIQGTLWQKKRSKFKPSDVVLPLGGYYDAFQANNNLGPHSLPIGGVYATILCLPPEVASRLENIFLSILFTAPDLKEFGTKIILKPLKKELELLEREGLEVMLPSGEKKHVYLVLGLFLGDNLGLHELFGFMCSFAFANFPCRLCKVGKIRMRLDAFLDSTLLRNQVNYKEDLLIGDASKTGIRHECDLNSDSFHVTDNLEGDILHDWDEGILHNVMAFVLTKLTDTKEGFFKLIDLNRRMSLFDFGSYSALYRTKLCVYATDLQNGKFKMTGSEMQAFVKSFGILMGDLVPEGNEVWRLYLSLLRCLDIVLAKSLPKSSLKTLQYYLKELGEQWLSFDYSFTFKFHKILWHYQSIIEHSGPICHLSVRRFESKHRELKVYANACMSRVNLKKSLAIKHQLKLCERFIAKKSILSEIMVGSGDPFLSLIDNCQDLSEPLLPQVFSDLGSIFVPNWIDYKGSRFDENSTVIIDIDDEFGWPLFGQVKAIYLCGKTVALLCQPLETVGFHEHIHAYQVTKSSCQKRVLLIESLVDPLPLNTLIAPTGGLHVILRYQV